MLRKILLGLLVVLLVAVAGGWWWLQGASDYQREGTLTLAVLDAPVRVVRDEKGMPYIHAESLEDAIRAQGFVTAQDRLFQIEFSKYLAYGRLSELIGAAGLVSDRHHRIAGLHLHGARHAAMLDAETRKWMELYLEGLNAYISQHRNEHPLGFRLLGFEAEPWTLADQMTLLYFLNWVSSVNLDAELIAQQIIDRVGLARASEISQMTVNADVGVPVEARPLFGAATLAGTLLEHTAATWAMPDPKPLAAGSNHWVSSAERSASGAPIVVNDPHVDSRTLPGNWHPVGLITPAYRAVGISGSGVPGLAVGRTDRVTFGITNSYGDMIDLFIETLDPQRETHYLDNGQPVPFELRDEIIRIRDRSRGGFREEVLTVRSTRRGPVISDHDLGREAGQVISMRWSAPEGMRADNGVINLFLARSVDEARAAVAKVTAPYNFVVADVDGNIAHFTAGVIPIRRLGDGSTPLPAEAAGDNWAGFIPPERMPATVNPARGWTGNANHRTLPADYPYSYSTYFAHSWRYRRLLELMGGKSRHSADDHWAYMRDTKNLMAARVVPHLVGALEGPDAYPDLAAVLAAWDLHDDTDAAAPAVFQVLYRHFSRLVFEDELGEELTGRMLGSYYYWQERLVAMIEANDSAWFDDTSTSEVETRDDLFRRAARLAQAELEDKLGRDPSAWRWGDLHQLTFFSPLVPGKTAARWLGGGTRPKDGSGETLNRATFKAAKPYDTTFIASMRMAADLADPDKVMAVNAGGASGRPFDPHLHDQVDAWFSGEPVYWWFSDAAIAEHAVSELRLTP